MRTDSFHQRIRHAIADEALQAALDGNAERRTRGRLAALATLPDWRERRQRAHAVRAEVIAHLDAYLEQFITQVQANGITVHRAADSAEALKTILEIIKASSQRNADERRPVPGGLRVRQALVAKSKSMVSEEINLNHALEAAGIRVVETDLGEYIVQLRGERPSHIITPAVHLRRHEVGQLFHDKLGIPYTEDIPTLTATARRVLREVFLTADVGLSGVNFGVAETGTLCIVTNEGNGRMVTTLPPVHIALMGMERLLPTLDDLALFLSLLPRSATGQKLSVYTQLIHAPRRANDPDGAEARHLILVDNGRSRLRDSSLREALYCIRCGACLNACPVFREIGGHAYVGRDGSIAPYPGPIGSVISPGLFGPEQFGQLAQASSLCGACRDACPVDIDLPKMLLRVRAGSVPQEGTVGSGSGDRGIGLLPALKLGLGLFRRVATRPRLFAVSQRLAAAGALVLSPFSRWMRLPAFTGWGYSKDFPRPAARPFRARFGRGGEAAGTTGTAGPVTPGPAALGEERPAGPTVNPIERLREELAALGVQLHPLREDELAGQVVNFLQARGIDAVQTWDEVPGLGADDLTKAGLRVVRSADESVRCGVTGALAGIVDTGTLVIPGGAGRPSTASLLTELHLAVLRASDLLPSLPEALRKPEVRRSPAVVLVTGPSRTADIEMALTIGVHGPKEVHVFLIDDSIRV
jgi:L-lactate dehydrogenase complex protein LldF